MSLCTICSRHAVAQDSTPIDQFISLGEVNADFLNTLNKVQSEPDTLEVYFNYIKRLIDRGNYIQADSVLSAHENSFTAISDSTFLAKLYKQRAFMYKVQRRLPQALQDYLWLRDYYEKKNDKNELVEIYSLMAEYYRAYRNFDLMRVHLDMAERIIRGNTIDLDHIAYWNGRKASWHTEVTGNYDSTQYYARISENLAKKAGDYYTQALALNELGFSINKNGDKYDSAMNFLHQSRELLLQTERYRDYVHVQNNIVLRFKESDSIMALRILETIIPLEEENNWYTPLSTSLSLVKDQYGVRGKTDKVDEATHKIYQARIDEIESDKIIAVNDLALTYQNQLTEKELEVQEQRAQLAESEARNNLRAFSVAAIIAFFLAIIAIIAIIVNRRFRKKNELLKQRKEDIETANSNLQKSLEQQKVLYKELNHRVKNNLTVLTGLIYLQELDENDEALRDSMKKLRNRIKSMALAHESLYNTESDGKINFGAYLEALFDDLKNALTKEQIVKTTIDCTNFELEIKHAIPLAMIMNELFTNSIKHGFKNYKEGLISIKGEVIDSQIIIHYQDNGSGYNPDQKQNLGLHLVGLLLEQIDASVEDKSSDKGFYIILSLPQFDRR